MRNSMAATASVVEPPPLLPRNLLPMIEPTRLTPETPAPLFPDAPMMPDTCVPCPASSIGSHVLLIALNPCVPSAHVICCPSMFTTNEVGADQIFPARSGCV